MSSTFFLYEKSRRFGATYTTTYTARQVASRLSLDKFGRPRLSGGRALSVSAMMVFYALEERSPHLVLAFAVASAYGFLQGAWPFGVVELVWSAVALNRWRHRLKPA